MSIFKVLREEKLGMKSLGIRFRSMGVALFALVALAATNGANASAIGDAVDAPSLTWTTGGDANWFSQPVTTKDGIDAAQSGDIADNQKTWMQTTVTGPGTIVFWWKVSSESTADYLKFYVDGTQLVSVVGISGYQVWDQKTASISNGVHTLKWEYSKDSNFSDEPDCGWVDQVVWSSIPYYTVSAIVNVPEWGSVTGSEAYASNTTCTVTATPNMGYQFVNWLEGTNEVATTANYTFNVTSNRTLKAKFTPMSYTIGTTANPAEGGTTSGDDSLFYNSSCTVIATPNTGYAFANWTEDGTNVWNSSSSYTFTVSRDRSLVANFTMADFSIVTSSDPIGGGTTTGGGEKGYNSTCTVIATPNAGYTFDKWTEGASIASTSSSYAFTVEGNRTLVAHFIPANYTITTSASPSVGGTATGGGLIAYNTSCTVVATTNIGYSFTSWTVDGSFVSASSSYTFTVTGNKTYVANFADLGGIGDAVDAPSLAWTTGGASPWFYQTATAHDGIDAAQSTNQAVFAAKSWIQTTVTGPGVLSFWCKVSPAGTDPDALSFYDNTISKFAVNFPYDSGWTNFSYSISGGSHDLKWEFHNQGTDNPGNAWLDEVVWTPFESTVAISSSPPDGGTLSGAGVFPSNTTCKVTAKANTGFAFDNWMEGSTVLATTTNYTFTVVSNRTLVANFTQIGYMIAASSSPLEGGSATGGGLHAYDSWCTLIASPNAGYTFTNWTEGAVSVSTSLNYTFKVDRARDLVAHFTPINYEVETSPNPIQGGSTSGGGTKAYDSFCTVIAMPSTGYTFVNWTEDGTNVWNSSTNYTFKVKGARTLVANFTGIQYTIATSPNPSEGGTTSGGGLKETGSSCTVSAAASPPWYAFANWTEGTNVVSSSTNYMFTVVSNRTLVANFINTKTIGHAVDAPELIWTTGGEAGNPVAGTTNWFPQTAITHDGVDAAQSGSISDGGTSWMQTVVTGPGTLSFWWKIQTLDSGDTLTFYDNGNSKAVITGSNPANGTAWAEKIFSIPAGTHTLRWAYVKDYIGSFAPDCGWVDQVVWTPTKPDLIVQSIAHSPANPQVGDLVTFTVTIKNQGAAEAQGVFNTAFWSNRATAPMIGTSPEQMQNYASTAIAPGSTRTLTFQILAPTAGTYKAWAYVDRLSGVSEINESNESNNAGPSNGYLWDVQSYAPLYNRIPIPNITGAVESTREYMITVPLGEALLNLTISGGIGNCDLYVKHGARATTTSYDYRSDLSGNDETVSVALPAPGSWYILLHAREAYAGITLVGTYSRGRNAVNDFDGDGHSDIAIFHPEAGNWYVQYSRVTNAPQAEQFGWWDVVPVPADYDGDGLIDIAVYYPLGGIWYIQESKTAQMRQVQWGWSEAAPVPGDYDGDGKADIAVFHKATGNWYIQYSTRNNAPEAQQFGWSAVVPVPADYDGDGTNDVAVYYPDGGTWYILDSTTELMRQVQWGWSEAVPVPGDYDGDGKADIAVFHRATGNWYIQYSEENNDPLAEQFGWSEVVPVPADYDGDGKTDVAVYYAPTGTWYIRDSTTEQMRQVQWGWSDAIPTLLITAIHDWFGLP